MAQLDLSVSPLDYLSRLFPGNKPDAIRAHLSQFGLSGDLALQRIGTLSGGQKSRVAFALCSWRKPHILVLDEPTNRALRVRESLRLAHEGGTIGGSGSSHNRTPHPTLFLPSADLDIETIDALVVALGSFQGGVLLVSHDAHFVDAVATQLWVVGEGRVDLHKGDFQSYRRVALGEKAKLGGIGF